MEAGRTKLVLEDLDVAAGSRTILRGISLGLDVSVSTAVVGPSGCGKTTLLRTVAGLADPASGRVLLDGKTGSEHGWPAFRRRVVYVAQNPTLLSGTVRLNLQRPFHYSVDSRAFDEDRAVELLKLLGLGPGTLDREARSLSVGQQQRVCLVRGRLVEPDVLLLDEPTSALDEENVELVETQLCHLVEEHSIAALVVTHDRSQAERMCSSMLDLQPFRAGAVVDG